MKSTLQKLIAMRGQLSFNAGLDAWCAHAPTGLLNTDGNPSMLYEFSDNASEKSAAACVAVLFDRWEKYGQPDWPDAPGRVAN